MTLRHSAALALVGWYLLAPPVTPGPNGSFMVNKGAPFSQWDHIDSYDAATDCSDDKAKISAQLNKLANPSNPKSIEAYIRSYSAECIATDDPRLKGEPKK
jgi:hypothetical protein